MKNKMITSSRWLLIGAITCAGASSFATAHVVQSLGAAERPLFFEQGSVRELVVETLSDLVNFRREHPLTEVQADYIRSLLAEHRALILTQARARIAAQKNLTEAIHSGTSDEFEVRLAARRVGDVLADGAVLRHKLAAEIEPVLTEEQRRGWRALLERAEVRIDAFLAQSL